MLKLFKLLLDKLRAELEYRKRRRATQRYERGYAAAMFALTRKLHNPEYLYRCTEIAKDFGAYSEYDDGIRAAIYDFELSGVDDVPLRNSEQGSLNTSKLQ